MQELVALGHVSNKGLLGLVFSSKIGFSVLRGLQ